MQDHEEAVWHDEAVPLCIGCCLPVSPLQHYCDHCGECVGKFTPYLPFEYIPYYAQFFGRLWDRVWYQREMNPLIRAAYFCFMVLYEPVLLLGLFSLAQNWRRTYRSRYGLCLDCGYDLKGSIGRSDCPECGAPL